MCASVWGQGSYESNKPPKWLFYRCKRVFPLFQRLACVHTRVLEDISHIGTFIVGGARALIDDNLSAMESNYTPCVCTQEKFRRKGGDWGVGGAALSSADVRLHGQTSPSADLFMITSRSRHVRDP